MTLRHTAILATHALVGWALCAATMGVGIAAMGLRTALIIHAIAAPAIFAVISAFYFRHFAYTSPLKTAATFVTVVIFLDATIIAVVVERSFEMFSSLAGTWLPFALIFASTYITGIVVIPHASRERAVG